MAAESLRQKYSRLAQTRTGVSKVGWRDALQQAVQFEALLALNIPPDAGVLDVGCGTADLLTLLTQRGFTGMYTGVDIMSVFINQAQKRFADRPNTRFIVGDIRQLTLPRHDFVLASGLFDYKTKNSRKEWAQIVKQLYRLAHKAVAWNAYNQCPPGRPDMWSVDIAEAANRCQELSAFWQIQADYASGHFTAFTFKSAYWLTPRLQTLIGQLFLDPALVVQLKTAPYQLAARYNLTIRQLNLLTALTE